MKYRLLFLLSFVWTCTFGQTSQEIAVSCYNNAETAYNNGDYAGAITNLDKAQAALGSTNSKILFLAINAYHSQLKNNYTDDLSTKERAAIGQFISMTDKNSYPADKYQQIVAIKADLEDIMATQATSGSSGGQQQAVNNSNNEGNGGNNGGNNAGNNGGNSGSDQNSSNAIVQDKESIRMGNFAVKKDDIAKSVGKEIQQMAQYTALLCEKKRVDEVTKNTMALFNNKEDILVEVTSGKKPPYKNRIRTYLQRLVQLNYQHVTVTNHEIQFMSDLTLQADGVTWKGYVTYLQDFTATKDNRVVYSDVTKKTAEITVRVTEDLDGEGQKHPAWRVFLGNISVSQSES